MNSSIVNPVVYVLCSDCSCSVYGVSWLTQACITSRIERELWTSTEIHTMCTILALDN
eukprot:c44425_g1_i1 orf=2-172(-)